MSEVIENTRTKASEYFAGVKSHDDGDYIKKDTLWAGFGDIRTSYVIISATGENADSPFKVNIDEPDTKPHYVNSGRKHQMLEDYFHGDTPREFEAKVQLQAPRDPKDVKSTYEWMKENIDGADKKIAKHKLAFANKDIRVAFVRKVS